jgi:hypothetical protein
MEMRSQNPINVLCLKPLKYSAPRETYFPNMSEYYQTIYSAFAVFKYLNFNTT